MSDNELIAGFMGFDIEDHTTFVKSSIKDPIIRTLVSKHISELQYHESWDWLMPVVEKIEAIEGIRFIIEKNRVLICSYGPEYFWNSGTTYDSKITTTYNAVVEFIKWYNENNKQR